MCNCVAVVMQETELIEAMQAADLDGDGTINYEEFIVATVNLAKLGEGASSRSCRHRPPAVNPFITMLSTAQQGRCGPASPWRLWGMRWGCTGAGCMPCVSTLPWPGLSGSAGCAFRRKRTLRRPLRTSTRTAAAR